MGRGYRKLTRILLGHTNFVNSLAFSGDGKQLASGDAAARVLLWDMATGKLVKTLLGHSGEVNALAFSRNGSVLVSAGEDTQVKVWNRSDRTTDPKSSRTSGAR